MKLCLLASLAGAASGFITSSGGVGKNPVTRVVGILQQLQQKCEEELEKEKSAFAKYKCWAQTIVDTKTASNDKAKSRKESLEQYVEDIEAGKIEFTTERIDLEKEIAGLSADIETTENLREQEHKDYLAAKAETEQAIVALTDAIRVLQNAQTSSFLDTHGRGQSRSPASYVALAHAVAIGRRFLSKDDETFLDHLINGDVPEWDWKKLNRKATFKMSYKSRSGKILHTLENLKYTFETNRKEMIDKEAKTVVTYNKLLSSKGAQKDAAEEALSKMELEGAVRGQTKSEALAEIEDLKTQMSADQRFINQTQVSLQAKEGEWADRQTIRQNEIKALSEAIAVLRSDEARDTVKRSFKSQGYSLLQLARQLSSASAQRQRDAVLVVRDAMRASGDTRLAKLVADIATGAEHFRAVIQAIDNILALLENEAKSDLDTKEECEKSRANNTRKAVLKAREVDELSDALTRLESEIAEIDTQLGEKADEVTHIEDELISAKRLREDENALWVQSNSDDENAILLIQSAVSALETFYKDPAIAGLVQKRKQPVYDNEFVVDAGQAPPPPPKTWEDPYSGHQEESKGIFTILSLLTEDIQADKAKAKQAEDDAAAAYLQFETTSNSTLGDIQQAITDLGLSKSGKEGQVETTKGDRTTAKGELESMKQTIKDQQAGCDFQLVNFHARNVKRQAEKDGLLKAKAVLQGATFQN